MKRRASWCAYSERVDAAIRTSPSCRRTSWRPTTEWSRQCLFRQRGGPPSVGSYQKDSGRARIGLRRAPDHWDGGALWHGGDSDQPAGIGIGTGSMKNAGFRPMVGRRGFMRLPVGQASNDSPFGGMVRNTA